MKTRILIFTLTLAISGCSTMSMTKNIISGKGQVLKEYEKGDDYYMVIKEGDRINKYRLYSWSTGILASGTQAENIYSIDTLTQTCSKGAQSQAPIDCQALKKDKDLNKFITW